MIRSEQSQIQQASHSRTSHWYKINAQILAAVYSVAIRHDILDFCERELVTLRGGGIEKKMGIIVLVKPRWNHRSVSDFQRMFSGKYVLSLV